MRALDKHEINEPIRDDVIARGTASAQPYTRDLFERYLPEEERTKRLGNYVSPDSILAIRGNARDGKKLLFLESGVQCSSCHQINGKGTHLGPDLSQIGKKYDRYRLLDSIVNPSREIEPKYVVQLVQTSDGQVLSGLRVEQTGDDVVLKSADNKEIHIAADVIEQMLPQKQSLMPEYLVRNMTAQQLADLIEYLSRLQGAGL